MEFVVRVLVPILDNAVRHAASTVTIDVSIVDGRIQVIMGDNGPGLPKEDHESLFEPGVRLGGGDGAGLGLALARRIARGFGGDVTVTPSSQTSAPGAEFAVLLPLAHHT